MRIACVGYRTWALNIYKSLQSATSYEFLVQSSLEDYSEREIAEFQPDFVLFYGWSEIISSELIERFICLMLHPSPLPKYRGGSPIQNQIIRNEVDSAVTIFRMDAGIDTGPIAKQSYLSLEGSIDEIFDRIERVGFSLTLEMLVDEPVFTEQEHESATQYRRRKPSDSEITQEELRVKPLRYLENKVRMLQDPYPNPYIITADNRRLYIHSISSDENK